MDRNAEINWPKLIREAFSRAQPGVGRPVLGARLRQQLAKLAGEQSIDIAQYLRSRDQTFVQFLEQQAPEFHILRRSGTDMLVAASEDDLAYGFAPDEPPGPPGAIRQDLYAALTVIADGKRRYYDRDADAVVEVDDGAEIETDRLVPLPTPSIDQELALRSEFAEQRDPTILEALNAGGRPLSAFQAAVRARGLSRDWHEYKYRALSTRLQKWAKEHNVEVRPTWFTFSPSAGPARTTGPRGTLGSLLAQVAEYMSDEQIREVKVPLGAVFDFMQRQGRITRPRL